MPQDPIVQVGEPVLRKVAKPLLPKDISARATKAIIAKMKRALAREKYGVAIAAPQVGSSLRIFVVSGKVFDEEKPAAEHEQETASPARVYINPQITRSSRKKMEMSEGCLSVRGQYGTVLRHEKVTLKALGEDGKPILQHASGLLAHIFQHECDHLEGVLFTDKTLELRPWDEHTSDE
ncbi:MAG TPA: peptide deformylase [Candidatus Paceibacterota bacterium]|nr:peptide deformylase [Candidatus Paceibacterota bacterium]